MDPDSTTNNADGLSDFKSSVTFNDVSYTGVITAESAVNSYMLQVRGVVCVQCGVCAMWCAV